MQVEKLKAEAAAQQAEVTRLHGTTVQQLYLEDLDAFLQAYEAWEADEAANSGLLLQRSKSLPQTLPSASLVHRCRQLWQQVQAIHILYRQLRLNGSILHVDG